MSRIGRLPIPIPGEVTVGLTAGSLTAKGPLGERKVSIPQGMKVEVGEKVIHVTRASDSKQHRSLHGLTRSLVNSAIVGVATGFVKELEIVGVGYRAELKGGGLVLHLGFSHPVVVKPPAGIEISVPDPTHVTVKGNDKQVVGQLAANIRAFRPPEPYKGKGVKYKDEHVRRKAGKTAVG
jgi:large subunit ribosomal protein L6